MAYAVLRFLALLLTISLCDADNGTITVEASCNSGLIEGGFSLSIRPDLDFHWILSDDSMHMVLQYQGVAWLSIGFSDQPAMIGSKAVIVSKDSGAKAYKLDGRTIADIHEKSDVPVESTSDPFIQTDNETVANFSVPLNSFFPINTDGLTTVLYAVGDSNEVSFHEHRGIFQVDLTKCTENSGSDSNGAFTPTNESGDAKLALQIHGALAFVAFGVCVPVALAAAIFRQQLPCLWYRCLHRGASVAAVLFSVGSLIAGIIGVTRRDGTTDQPIHSHRCTGIILFVLFSSLIYHGYWGHGRQTKFDHASESADTRCIAKVCNGVKHWYKQHLALAAIVVVLMICQLRSGLRSFKTLYGNDPNEPEAGFWVYILIVCVCLIVGKVCVFHHAHESTGEIINTNTTEEEEDDNEFEEGAVEETELV